MGPFRLSGKVHPIADRSKPARVKRLLVDTRRGYTGLPAPVLEKLGVQPEKKDVPMANGMEITRGVGEAVKNIEEAIRRCHDVRAERGLPLTVEMRQVEVAV